MDTETRGRPHWGCELWSAHGPQAPVGGVVSGLPLNYSSLAPGGWALPTPAPGAHPGGSIQPLPRTKPSEAVGREEGGQERVSKPHSSSSQPRLPHHVQQSWGLWGPAPCMTYHSGKPAHSAPRPQEVRARAETGQDSLSVLGALAPGSTDIIPSQPPSFQKAARSTFLELHLFSWGVPGWRGETQHPESTALRGNFCTPFIQSFSISPRPPEATVPGPLHLPAPDPPGLAAQLPQPKP